MNYELRICSIYDDLMGSWSKIEKFKTTDIDSLILKDEEKRKEFFQKIFEWSGYKRMELLYRGTRDGSTADIFHKKCDNQGPLLSYIKMKKEIYLEVMLLFHGQILEEINLLQIVLYLH